MSSWDFSPFELSLEELVHIVYLILNKVLISPELQFISITKGVCFIEKKKKIPTKKKML